MSLPADIYTALNDVALGGIHPLRIPPGPTFPLIVYQRVSSPELHVADYVEARYQFSCWAETHPEAEDTALALRTRLEGFHGSLGATHVRSLVVNRIDDYDQLTGLWRVILDAKLFYRET